MGHSRAPHPLAGRKQQRGRPGRCIRRPRAPRRPTAPSRYHRCIAKAPARAPAPARAEGRFGYPRSALTETVADRETVEREESSLKRRGGVVGHGGHACLLDENLALLGTEQGPAVARERPGALRVRSGGEMECAISLKPAPIHGEDQGRRRRHHGSIGRSRRGRARWQTENGATVGLVEASKGASLQIKAIGSSSDNRGFEQQWRRFMSGDSR
jgi:hypothetical protein